MSLIVEDGTGLATAESYTSVAAADAHHTALGNPLWTGTDAVKEAALRRATQFMLQAFRDRWHGFRMHKAQVLDWPRWNVWVDGYPIDTNVVPPEVANACADLALRALADDLNADLTRAIVREKVGPLETEYDRYSPQATRFRAIDMALAPFLKGSGANASLIRA